MKNQKIENPFIGLRTYEEADARQFRGRASATADLYGLIEENEVVVLHAESGEGKSSLLNAGLFPLMRDERYFPVKVSFTEDDFALETPDFDKIVCQRIVEAVNAINGDAVDTDIISDSARMDGKVSLVFAGKTSLAFPEIKTNIWWLLRNYSLKAYGAELTPVLVFDQFEEVFTRPGDISWTEDFFLWLRSTLNDETPEKVVDAIRSRIGEYATFPRVSTDKKFRALFSLRTEYIGELDYWAIQRHHISVLKNSRYCLKPLTEHEADEVLDLQPAFSEEVKGQIKQAICSSQTGRRHSMQLPMIPAMLLSVVSTTASNNVQKTGKAYEEIAEIKGESLGSDVFTNIIAQFYNREVGDLKIPRKILREIEGILVDDKGKRVRIKADAKELRLLQFETKYKPQLEQKRLIKCTKINGDEYVEITHDAIARVIVRQHDASTRDRAKWAYIGVSATFSLAVVLVIGFFCTIILNRYVSSAYENLMASRFHRILYLFWILGGAVVISCLGIKAYRKSRSERYKLIAAVCAYAGIMLFYDLSNDILALRAYWNEIGSSFWIRRFERQLMALAAYTSCFAVGIYLCRRKPGERKSSRWLSYSGRIVAGLFVVLLISYMRLWTGAIMVLMVLDVFWCLSYIMTRDKNTMWLSGISAVFFTGVLCIFNNFDDLPRLSILSLIIASLIFVVIGALFEKKRSMKDAFAYVTEGKVLKNYKIVRFLLGLCLMSLLILISIDIGMGLNDINSLVGMILVCPASVYVLRRFVFGLESKSIVIKAVYLLTLCTATCIWGAQYAQYRFWIIIAMWIASVTAIIILNYKRNVADDSSYTFEKNIGASGKYVVVYFISGMLMPYLLMGYNYTSVHSVARVYGRIGQTQTSKYVYVRDSLDRFGLMDRKGALAVPAQYDDIVKIYSSSYNDDNYYGAYYEDGFMLIDGWEISYWDDNEFNANDDVPADPTEQKTYDGRTMAQKEESEILLSIGQVIRNNNDSVGRLPKWSFDYREVGNLQRLHNIDVDSIHPDLCLTSERFRNIYLNKILPNLKVGGLGTVSSVVSPSFDWDVAIKNYISAKGKDDDPRQRVSDRITDEMLVRQEIGNKLSRIAYYYLVGGQLEKAERVAGLSFEKGAYMDFGKTVYLASLLLQGKESVADEFMNEEGNKLVTYNIYHAYNMDNGIFPEQEDAWYELRYMPIEWSLGLMRLPVKQYEELIGRYENTGYSYIIRGMLPFDKAQLIEDPVNGNAYRFMYSFITPEGRNRTYSYYVRDNERITPPLSFWSYPLNDEEAPVLAVDVMTKKRLFVKFDSLYQNVEYLTNDYSIPHKLRSQRQLQTLAEEAEGSYDIYSVRQLAPVEIQTVPTMLEGEYDHAWPFSEGLAAVEVNGKIGFIDTEGKIVIEPQFMSPYKPRKDFYGSFYGIYNMGKYAQPYFKNGVCTVYDSNGKIIGINKAGESVF